MANIHMKRCTALLSIREIQVKTAVKYHLTLVRMAIIKKSTSSKCWRGCGEKGTLLHCWWKCKMMQLLPGRGAGTLLPSAQRFVWAARQPLGNAALGALFA